MVVVQDYLAEFWKKVFTNLTVHDTVAVRTGASLAVAIRKNSPRLKAELDAFLSKFGLGTAFGNIMAKRYLESTSSRRRRPPKPSGRSSWRWSSYSGSTASSTRWTTC